MADETLYYGSGVRVENLEIKSTGIKLGSGDQYLVAEVYLEEKDDPEVYILIEGGEKLTARYSDEFIFPGQAFDFDMQEIVSEASDDDFFDYSSEEVAEMLDSETIDSILEPGNAKAASD